ncbi:amine oxidase A [Nephila pilipes]|uniref:Amine oxidase n=1 Tax=Nephila pilipes TaxID=299642 RepID=A0A8X6N677_NEPPI|nr:amine oxidase A [Nephila pilipes]
MDSEVIIIGAGLSGLCAAKLLKEAEVSVIVLEALDRVGGRTLTKRDPKTDYADLGASFAGPTQDHLFRLTKQLGIKNYEVNQTGDSLFYKNGTRISHKPGEFPAQRNPFIIMDINNIWQLIDKMGKEIPAISPWDAPHANEWDTLNIKDFLQRYCWTKTAIEFFSELISLFITSSPYEVSLLSFLWYVKQCGGLKRMMYTKNGAQERKFHGGTQQISEKIADIIGDSQVIKSSPVVAINQESKAFVTVKTLNGKEYKTNFVILACSPTLQQKIHYLPQLPPIRNQLIQRMPIGSIMKIILYYQTAFWKEKGFCGSAMIFGDDHPMFLTFEDTKPNGNHPAISGYITAEKCRKMERMSMNERKNAIIQSLEKVMDSPEALKPFHYEEKIWMNEQYISGCCFAMLPLGFITMYGRFLRTPIDRLYFAGTETAVKWPGYMNGAIEAGERAAREVLHKIGKITHDQIWIDEPKFPDITSNIFVDTFGEKYLPSVTSFIKLTTLTCILGMSILVFLKYHK